MSEHSNIAVFSSCDSFIDGEAESPQHPKKIYFPKQELHVVIRV